MKWQVQCNQSCGCQTMSNWESFLQHNVWNKGMDRWLYHIQCSAVITQPIFSQKTPHSSPVRARHGVSFVSSTFDYVLSQLLQCCTQHNVILHHIIAALNCTYPLNALYHLHLNFNGFLEWYLFSVSTWNPLLAKPNPVGNMGSWSTKLHNYEPQWLMTAITITDLQIKATLLTCYWCNAHNGM